MNIKENLSLKWKNIFPKKSLHFQMAIDGVFILWTIYRCISLIYSNYIQKKVCKSAKNRKNTISDLVVLKIIKN